MCIWTAWGFGLCVRMSEGAHEERSRLRLVDVNPALGKCRSLPHTINGGCISMGGILVHTRRPSGVVPKKEPVAVLSVLMTW